ncbi:hypothetical protein [Methanosphaera sp.]
MKNNTKIILFVFISLILLTGLSTISATSSDNITTTDLQTSNIEYDVSTNNMQSIENTYYVSTEGTSNNTGLSHNNAWDLETGFRNIQNYNNSKLIISQGDYKINNTIIFNSSNNHYEITAEDNSVIFNGTSRIMYINSGNTIKLNNISFINAYITDNGGAIENEGNLSIINCTFKNNNAYYQKGGAIYNTGSLTVTNSEFTGNQAQNGGAIYNENAELILINNTFNNNNIVNSAGGGAIFNTNENNSTTIIRNNFFYSCNAEYARGGTLYNEKGNVIFSENYVESSQSLNGACIYNLDNITIHNNTFTKNYGYDGSVVYNWGYANITNNTITNNSVSAKGVLYNMGTMNIDSNIIQYSSANIGGAIYNARGQMNVINNTLTDNTASRTGGAIYNQADMLITDNIIQNNKALMGAGLYNEHRTMRHTTEDYMSSYTMYFYGNMTASRNTFSNNTNTNTSNPGCDVYNKGELYLTDNLFTNNKGENYTKTIIYNDVYDTNNGGLLLIQNNTIITVNKVLLNKGNVNVINNTIINTTNGVIETSEHSILIDNNIFINNTITTEDGFIITSTDNNQITIRNNVFINNTNNIRDMLFSDFEKSNITNNTYIGNYLNITIITPVELSNTNNITLYLRNIYNTTVNNGTITVYSGDELITTTDVVNNTCKIAFRNMSLGEHNITITYTSSENNYQNKTITTTVLITYMPDVTITIKNIQAQIKDIIKITSIITDENGNNITHGQIVFKINGKALRDNENNIIYVNVDNGQAVLENFTVPSKWLNINTMTAVYDGEYNLLKINNNTVRVTKRMAILTVNETIKTENNITLKIKISDDNLDITSGKVVFKVNGKSIRDSEGNVKYINITSEIVEIKITVPKNNYTITCIYCDKNYIRSQITIN